MEGALEQLIECDKNKNISNTLKVLSLVCILVSGILLMISLMISILMALIALALFVLSYLSYVEYEYELFNDTITISKIYSESKRKVAKKVTLGNVKKVYENSTSNKNKEKIKYYNSNIKGLSIYTFELNDNKSIELALNDKFKKRVGIIYSQKVVK